MTNKFYSKHVKDNRVPPDKQIAFDYDKEKHVSLYDKGVTVTLTEPPSEDMEHVELRMAYALKTDCKTDWAIYKERLYMRIRDCIIPVYTNILTQGR